MNRCPINIKKIPLGVGAGGGQNIDEASLTSFTLVGQCPQAAPLSSTPLDVMEKYA